MNAPTVTQTLGNIPAVRNSFYVDNAKPELKLSETQRAVFLYFKKVTDKATKAVSLRSSMALILNVVQLSDIRKNEKGEKFLQALVNDRQELNAKFCAESKVEFTAVESADAMIADYFEAGTSKRVSQDQIGAWFESDMSEMLFASIVAKYPKWEEEKVSALVGQYKVSFAALTKRDPVSKQVCDMLTRAYAKYLEDMADDAEVSEVAEYVGERLKKFAEIHNNTEKLEAAI